MLWIVFRPTSACWEYSCFRNPPNSDMDYMIFNACMWLFLCVRIHTGVGHTDNESAQHFWLGKTLTFFLCSWRGSNLVFGSRVRGSTNWATPSPYRVDHSHVGAINSYQLVQNEALPSSKGPSVFIDAINTQPKCTQKHNVNMVRFRENAIGRNSSDMLAFV